MDAQVKCFFRLDERKKKSVVSVCKSDVKTHQNSHQNSFFFFFFLRGEFFYLNRKLFFSHPHAQKIKPPTRLLERKRARCVFG